MDLTLNKIKVNILKKMLGKKMFVVTNSLTNEGYCGTVTKVINHETVCITNDKVDGHVNIFDLRTPSRIYNCE